VISYPRSSLAEPPITSEEAGSVDLTIDTSVCRWHKGQLTHLNADGKVYFCPIGQQYWRYSNQSRDMYAPLNYR
jgi:hypothetical protein